MKLRPLNNTILIHKLEKGQRTLASGIIILNDDGKEHGVRARWAQVYEVGPEEKFIQKDQWVLIEHGRWSRGIEVDDDTLIYRADGESILAISDDEPDNDQVGNTTEHGFTKVRY